MATELDKLINAFSV
jgi:hypothetical protein